MYSRQGCMGLGSTSDEGCELCSDDESRSSLVARRSSPHFSPFTTTQQQCRPELRGLSSLPFYRNDHTPCPTESTPGRETSSILDGAPRSDGQTPEQAL